MLGSRRLTALLGSAPPATADTAVLSAYAKALQREGLALFLITPGGKTPAECRSPQAKTKDIKEAKAAGLPETMAGGLHMATTEPVKIDRWLKKYRKDRGDDVAVNMAVEVGRSRLVVVDVDTASELDAFRATWAERSGDPDLRYVPPTVSSPGAQNDDGTWSHKDGGHFYFTLPEGAEVPEGAPSTITFGEGDRQWVARIRDAYVLIPPSERKEGRYEVTGTDHPIPDWLLTDLVNHVHGRIQHREQRKEKIAKARAAGEVDSIDTWSESITWAEILTAAKWTPAGRADRCGCDIWTRPGDNPSPKSATAHTQGCSDDRFFGEVSPPIHVWSDNVEGGLADWIAKHGTKTLSKLQFVAAVSYDGDVSAAMSALGLEATGTDMHGTPVPADLAATINPELVSTEALAADVATPPKRDLTMPTAPAETPAPASPFAQPVGAEAAETPSSASATAPETSSSETAETPAEDGPRRPLFAPFDEFRHIPPPTYIVDGWVEDLALSAFIGASGVGKSALVLDMACSIVTGVPWQGRETRKSRVLYVAGEGLSGAAQRVKAWEVEHGLNVGQDLYMIPEPVSLKSDAEQWDWLADQIRETGIRLVIFDTLARMSLGLEENSATDMGNAVARFDKLRREAGTGVMVVHHTARGATHGRGSSAIIGALDSEILVEHEDDEDEEGAPGKHLTATVSKQKNGEDGLTMDLYLVQRHGSIIVADASGNTSNTVDPFTAPVIPIPSMEESSTELAIRIKEFLDTLPVEGGSLADIARGVEPSRAYRDNPAGWRTAVLRAKDRGLATGLISHSLSSSTKYVCGSSTPAQALALDRAEAADASASDEADTG